MKHALRMAHQVEKLMDGTTIEKLGGIVCSDEACFGMKSRNRNRKDVLAAFNRMSKISVVGMIGENEAVKTELIRDPYKSGRAIGDIVKDNVSPSATLVNDGAKTYLDMDKYFDKHIIINYHLDQYVKDGFTTNNIENY